MGLLRVEGRHGRRFRLSVSMFRCDLAGYQAGVDHTKTKPRGREHEAPAPKRAEDDGRRGTNLHRRRRRRRQPRMPPAVVLLLGLEGAGKTKILYHLKLGALRDVALKAVHFGPTAAFNYEVVSRHFDGT